VITGTAVPDTFATVSNRPGTRKTQRAHRTIEDLAFPAEDALSMRQNERISLLAQEWDRWLKTQPAVPSKPTPRDTLKFYCELQDKRSPLLDFRASGRDKWQIIHGWLRNEKRVSD
jgi:hypothetical protein